MTYASPRRLLVVIALAAGSAGDLRAAPLTDRLFTSLIVPALLAH